MFESIIEPLKENLQLLRSRITESAVYNSIKEKYLQLPSKVQKIVGIAAVLLVVLILFSIPIGRYRASLAYDAEFNEKREIISKLLEISSAPKANSPSGFNNPAQLTSIANRKLQMLNLSSQGEVFTPTNPLRGSFAKAPIRESAYKVELKNLNLKQAIAAGHGLQNLMPLAKLTGLKIYKSPEMADYLNVEYVLSYFQAPEVKQSEAPSKRN